LILSAGRVDVGVDQCRRRCWQSIGRFFGRLPATNYLFGFLAHLILIFWQNMPCELASVVLSHWEQNTLPELELQPCVLPAARLRGNGGILKETLSAMRG
jgi:hypothetical protein